MALENMSSLIRRFLPFLVLTINWDLVPWLIRRAKENEDAALLHGLLACAIFGWWRSNRKNTTCHPLFQGFTAAGFLLCAAGSFFHVYPLVRMLFLSATLATALLCQLPRPLQRLAAVGGACLLLPFSEETAAFFLGYPARWISIRIAGGFLTLAGNTIHFQGAVLFINEQPLFADAPCAGLMMGWTGFAIASLIALHHELSFLKTIRLYFGTLLLILLGNALRMTFLAQLSVLLPDAVSQDLLHNSIGIFSFVILIPLLMWLGKRSENSSAAPCSENRLHPALGVCLLLAWSAPFQQNPGPTNPTHPPVFSWPTEWEGLKLDSVESTELDKRFALNFPGSMQRFQSGSTSYLFRYLETPSRQLHASEQCYRANGYRTRPLPAVQGKTDALWSVYSASKGGKESVVKEQIRSLSSDKTWPDVSAWYWDAVTGRDPGPWLAVTIAK